MKNTINEGARILIWDIETCTVANGFKADMGWIQCIGYKWLGDEKAQVIKLTDFPKRYKRNPTDDLDVIREFAKIYEQADVTVAHYGSVFDRRYLEGRLAIQGLPPLPRIKLVDTCIIARSQFAFSSNSLKKLGDIFKLKSTKTASNFPLPWFEIAKGGAKAVKAINFIAKYCKDDVEATEELYLLLRSRTNQHPHVGVILGHGKAEACQRCGSTKLVRNGKRISASGTVKQELKCKNCGGYTSASMNPRPTPIEKQPKK